MKTVTRLPQERMFGLVLAALTIIVGAWVIYRFGPHPEKTITGQEANNQPASASSPKIETAKPAFGIELLNSLFKASTTQVASGRSGDSPAKYLESLEAIYRSRGYRRFEPAAGSKNLRQALSEMQGNVYWRVVSREALTIGAMGEDADPNTTDKDSKKQFYVTTVSPAEGGGSQWTTYRYFADTPELQALQARLQSNEDLPGQDPPEVPRPPGLRRVISFGNPGGQGPSLMAVYQSQMQPESLGEWYTKEMPLAGWSLNPRATAQAGEQARGALYFTKGNRSCLIWIKSGAGSGPASVIISWRTL